MYSLFECNYSQLCSFKKYYLGLEKKKENKERKMMAFEQMWKRKVLTQVFLIMLVNDSFSENIII